MDISQHQVLSLFLIALPIACISWTVTHEEIFRGFREFCAAQSEICKNAFARKLFYVFTCEFCFSHYVTALFLAVTSYKLLFFDWRGYLISGFSLVWIANIYVGFFARLRLDIKKERVEINEKEQSANG